MIYRITFLTLLSTALLLGTACEDDGGPQVGSPYNSFDIGSQNYETYSGALLFDEGPVFSDRYAFAFQDGTITINSISIDYAGETAQVDLMYTISDGTTTLTG